MPQKTNVSTKKIEFSSLEAKVLESKKDNYGILFRQLQKDYTSKKRRQVFNRNKYQRFKAAFFCYSGEF